MSKNQDDLGYWGKLFKDKRRRAAAIIQLVEEHRAELDAALFFPAKPEADAKPKPAPKTKPKAPK